MSAPRPAPAPIWRTRTLCEDAEIAIELHERTPPSPRLVVTFDPLLVVATQPAYAHAFVRTLGADQLAVRKKRENFYQPLSADQFDAVAAPVLARYRHRVAYGSSLGAYAALYFCAGRVDQVIASSPRNSSHPEFGVARWQADTPFQHERLRAGRSTSGGLTVFYDPLDPTDRPYVDRELRPAFPAADWRPLRCAGHPANEFLQEIGFITPFVRAVVHQRPLPQPDLVRRKTSATWLAVLALCNTHRGRPRWGQALARRAHALKPDRPPVLRALVEAELALAEPDAAQAHIDRFVAAFPAQQALAAGSQHLVTAWRARAAAREAAAAALARRRWWWPARMIRAFAGAPPQPRPPG